MSKQILVLVVFFALTVVSAQAEDGIQKKTLRKGPPQLAGIGMVAMKHNCTVTYQTCLATCSSVAGCAKECDADCDVCALDFGEETLAVCQR